MRFFAGRFPCLPFLVFLVFFFFLSPVLLFCLLSPSFSFSPFFVFSSCHLFPFCRFFCFTYLSSRSSCFFLGCSCRHCLPFTHLFLLSLVCLFLLLPCWILSFPFSFLPLLFFYHSSSVASRWWSDVFSCPSPVVSSCLSFRSFPFGQYRLSSSVLLFPSPPSLLLSYPWSLPHPSFSFVSLVSFTAPAVSLGHPPPSPFFSHSSFLFLFLLFLFVIYTFSLWTSSFSFLSQGSLVLSFRFCWYLPFLCFCFLCQLVPLLSFGLRLLPLVLLVPFMMILFSFLLLMITLFRKVWCSLLLTMATFVRP